MTLKSLSRVLATVALVPMLWSASAQAQDIATLDEAQAMAERAVALFQAEGADAAFAAFNDDPTFRDRDLYVFVLATDGTVAAHGANHNLMGRNVIDLRDPTGRQFIREFVEVADTDWVEYQWQNSQSGAVEDKTSYVVNVGDYVIGVGAYQQ